MLNNIAKEIVEKYSFVKKVDIKGGYFYVYYDKDNQEKVKKISTRASKEQLQNLIKKIMVDCNYKLFETKMQTQIKHEMEREHAMYAIINQGVKQ